MLCNKCEYKTSEQAELNEHMKQHTRSSNQKDETEKEKLKVELRALTNSYDRLTSMCKKGRDEMKGKLGEYKIELEEAQENFRVAEAEN